MKERLVTLLIAFVPSALITVMSEQMKSMNVKYKIVIFLMSLTVIWLVIEFVIFIWSGVIRSKIDLWKIGKIKGLWQKEGLIKQTEKRFRESNEVKIKVTRAYDLFKTDQKYGFVKILNELKRNNLDINIKFLLIIPCFQEKHVQDRYERHNGFTKGEFLETWYK